MLVRTKIAANLMGTLWFAVIACLFGCSDAKAAISYACDPTIGAFTCTYLNTAIAGLYNSTFTNTDADIYITHGTTALSETNQTTGFVSYSTYVSALGAESGTGAGPVRTAAMASLR
jgi:hypothetical protein